MSPLKNMGRRFTTLVGAVLMVIATIGGATPAVTWCVETLGALPLVAAVAFGLGFAVRDAWAHRLPPDGPAT